MLRFTIIQNDVLLAHAFAGVLGAIVGQTPVVAKCGRETRIFSFTEDIRDDFTQDGILLNALYGDLNEDVTPRARQYFAAGMCSLSPGHVIEIEGRDGKRRYLCEANGWRRI